MAAQDERNALEAAKRASVAQLLFKCARLLNERALTELRRTTGQPMRAAHTALLPHIDLDGTRLTDLAARVGISKQAVGQLVDELEEMDALERVPDPADGRAKLIRFARHGGRLRLFEGLAVLGALDAELATTLGNTAMQDLHRTLCRLVDWLEPA